MLLASIVEPSFGLIFWMTLSFLAVLFILAKFAWKPILKGLKDREASIADALNEAKKARDIGANQYQLGKIDFNRLAVLELWFNSRTCAPKHAATWP